MKIMYKLKIKILGLQIKRRYLELEENKNYEIILFINTNYNWDRSRGFS